MNLIIDAEQRSCMIRLLTIRHLQRRTFRSFPIRNYHRSLLTEKRNFLFLRRIRAAASIPSACRCLTKSALRSSFVDCPLAVQNSHCRPTWAPASLSKFAGQRAGSNEPTHSSMQARCVARSIFRRRRVRGCLRTNRSFHRRTPFCV